jgi:hypothetical protein
MSNLKNSKSAYQILIHQVPYHLKQFATRDYFGKLLNHFISDKFVVHTLDLEKRINKKRKRKDEETFLVLPLDF